MKKLLLGSMAIATLAMVGCSNENDLLFDENTQEVFSGEIITSNSRTSLSEEGKVLWSDGDAINLFKKTGYYQKYVVKQGGAVTTDFVYGGVSKKGAALDHHYAVYPYAEGNTIDAKVISVDLSGLAEQTYVAGSFDPADAVMVAKSENTNLPFTNTLSMARVKISIGGSVVDATVQSIKFTSTAKALAGNATIDMTQDRPAAVITGSGKEITLIANDAVLSTEVTPFYVLIPANTYEAGTLKLTVNATVNGVEQEITKEYDALNFQRSLIETFNIDITEDGNWSGSTDGEISTHIVVSTAEELAALLTSSKDEISVKLANDIDLPISSLGQQTGGSGEYKLGGENTKNIIIDLNDKKLNITTTYWSAIGAKNNDALFTIKNGSINSTGNNAGTWNAWDLRFSNCNYVFENVDFEKAVALDNVGKSTLMKDVTITDNHNTDTYGLWITAEGQTVTLENCIIDMTPATDGRGIKIDNQYIAEADQKKVTLNVNNVTFKTEEKAAILVKSVAGAEINASNLNISEVVEDKDFAVWVDEDAAAYADLVEVNGALKVVEGTVATVSNNEKLVEAINGGKNTILLADGKYVMPELNLQGKTLTLVGTKETVIDVSNIDERNQFVTGATLKFDGVTLNFGTALYMGFANTKELTYKDCIINGVQHLYGPKVNFDGCTLNVAGDNYMVRTWGGKNVNFSNCTFNCDGKALLVYNQSCDLTITNCVFNDNGDGTISGKAAIEVCNGDNGDNCVTHNIIITNTTVNGFDINTAGINTNSTLWANKNSLDDAHLNVTIDGTVVY